MPYRSNLGKERFDLGFWGGVEAIMAGKAWWLGSSCMSLLGGS